ncbi:MAG: hypothetical protein IKY01_07020 [Prevotella sp.]|nr:hypothetical protein [Prevotella sp.]MBR5748523.1 hypothetical protein [Prevotella sp.]
MIQNLFSVLSEEQINSLTQEERQTLTRLDEKLFPDYDKYVDEHMKQKSMVERVLDRHRAEERGNVEYQQMMESEFC